MSCQLREATPLKTLKLKTNLRCAACVDSIRPLLDANPAIVQWDADVEVPDKILTVVGPAITSAAVGELLGTKGYRVLGEIPPTPLDPIGSAPAAPANEAASGPATSYFPLLLILFYLCAATSVFELAEGGWDSQRAMRHFMAGFFLVFSFFKLLDLQAFADAYAGYDLLAARWRVYGLAYPMIELGLGLAYLSGIQPRLTNWITVIVMGIGTLGVVKTLVGGRKIRCACLGAVFNLPMSSVTLIEDLLMVGMAVAMLWRNG